MLTIYDTTALRILWKAKDGPRVHSYCGVVNVVHLKSQLNGGFLKTSAASGYRRDIQSTADPHTGVRSHQPKATLDTVYQGILTRTGRRIDCVALLNAHSSLKEAGNIKSHSFTVL